MSIVNSLEIDLLAALPQVIAMPSTLPSPIPDPEAWDRNLDMFKPWWLKMKHWIANLKTYPNAEICQVVAVRMSGSAKGFAMQLIEGASQKGWQF